MKDLFSLEREFTPIILPDADVSILHGFETPAACNILLENLIDGTIWRQESVRLYGKLYPQPRLIAWYADPGKQYEYSGISLAPLPWTDLLREIKKRVEGFTRLRFNSVLVNLYRDHRDSMGLHSDDEPELGPEPTIASLSFGATRTFVMKHKAKSDVPVVKFPSKRGRFCS